MCLLSSPNLKAGIKNASVLSQALKPGKTIPFEITGGSENTLQVFMTKKIATINRPFIFSLPVDCGEHSCRVISGSEEVTISFTVK